MSTLNATDLFAVRRGSQTYKVSYHDVLAGVVLPSVLTYMGATNPTAAPPAPTGGLKAGMTYVLTPGGKLAAGWTGIAGINATDGQLTIWEGAKWELIGNAGAIPQATETVSGIVELATAAETTTGTDATRAVHPAGLKVELDKKANLASPTFTDTPAAPTAAVGTNTTQVATTAFVEAARLWDSTPTALSPRTAGAGLNLGSMTDGGGGYVLENAAKTKGGFFTFAASGDVQLNAVNTGLHLVGKTKIDFETAGVTRGTVNAAGELHWVGPIVSNTGLQIAPTGTTVGGPGSKGTVLGLDPATGGYIQISRSAHAPIGVSRIDSTGSLIEFYDNTTAIGSIGSIAALNGFGLVNSGGRFGYAGSQSTQMRFQGNNGGAPFAFFDGGSNNIANVTPAGAWTPASDRKLKTNIEALPYGLAEIKRLEPKSYHFKTVLADNPDAHKNIGLIAQEVKAVIPEVVHESIDGVLGLGYSELIPVLINAVKELSAQVDALKALRAG